MNSINRKYFAVSIEGPTLKIEDSGVSILS